MDKNKHLNLHARYEIQHGLEERLSFKEIGRRIGKDCTTISKEIKGHVIFKKIGGHCRPFNDCANRKTCKHIGDICKTCTNEKHRSKCSFCHLCTSVCKSYVKEICEFLNKPPYVCNGCPKRNECSLEKHIYSALDAHKEYVAVRSESRSGFNLSEDELKELDSIISPLILNGQSIHHILSNNKDKISCSEKTAYIYADYGLFTAKNIDMPRKVRFRPRKRKSVPLKVDKKCTIGRKYDDFKNYCKNNPGTHVVELDTVEGKKGSKVLLTIHFVECELQLAYLREFNNSQSVIDIFSNLYELLGKDKYEELFPLLLADNGTEFSNPSAIELDKDGKQISHIFYCNPSAPYEKGACEENHEMIRRIIPKGVDIAKYTQDDITLMMSHINSYSRPELHDKTPFDTFEFYYGEGILNKLGIKKISQTISF